MRIWVFAVSCVVFGLTCYQSSSIRRGPEETSALALDWSDLHVWIGLQRHTRSSLRAARSHISSCNSRGRVYLMLFVRLSTRHDRGSA